VKNSGANVPKGQNSTVLRCAAYCFACCVHALRCICTFHLCMSANMHFASSRIRTQGNKRLTMYRDIHKAVAITKTFSIFAYSLRRQVSAPSSLPPTMPAYYYYHHFQSSPSLPPTPLHLPRHLCFSFARFGIKCIITFIS
jgi:hypothetical protein